MPLSTATTPWRPRWIPLLVALLFIALFIRLGVWQLSRADEKRDILASAADAPVSTLAQLVQEPERYADISMSGYFDSKRHLLLDNQVLNGRPGVHVWTPFHADTGDWLLVNRGWLPLTPDRRLPEFSTPSETLQIRGRVNQPPRVGRRLGADDQLNTKQWPQLVTYLDLAPVSAALDIRLQDWIVQLDANSPAGFEGRDWPVVNFGPEKHLSYAWTWFSLALAVFIVTVIVQRPKQKSAPSTSDHPPARRKQA